MKLGVITIIAACISGFLLTLGLAQERGWRGIVPLHSTRTDVERLIGPPISAGGITYDLKSERVNVVYSNGDCHKPKAEWNVPASTVLGITVYPQTKVMLSDLVDPNRLKKVLDPHIGDSIFVNEEEGMSIRTTSSEEVISISYFPSAKDAHLRCPGYSTRPLSNDELQYFRLDEYSILSLVDERARLDKFAARLKQDPKSKAYILAYTRRDTPSIRRALSLAKRARAYLIKKWRVDASRLETRFAGSRENVTIQLCLVPESFQSSSSKP